MYLPTYLFGEYADGKDATGQKLILINKCATIFEHCAF